MTNFEMDGGTTRDDLVQRVALMEAMIAEGRRSTARFGWIFVMWGLVYFAAMGWVLFLPFANFAWPVCIVAAIVILAVAKARRRRAGAGENQRSRNIEAVWMVMGIAITLYIYGGILSHHFHEPAYIAAVLFFIGTAHATSAMILRWVPQGLVATIWWACGIATFFVTPGTATLVLFLTATFFGQIVFGLYVMMLERRRIANSVQHHA